jgi:hypothetical protein
MHVQCAAEKRAIIKQWIVFIIARFCATPCILKISSLHGGSVLMRILFLGDDILYYRRFRLRDGHSKDVRNVITRPGTDALRG